MIMQDTVSVHIYIFFFVFKILANYLAYNEDGRLSVVKIHGFYVGLGVLKNVQMVVLLSWHD